MRFGSRYLAPTFRSLLLPARRSLTSALDPRETRPRLSTRSVSSNRSVDATVVARDVICSIPGILFRKVNSRARDVSKNRTADESSLSLPVIVRFYRGVIKFPKFSIDLSSRKCLGIASSFDVRRRFCNRRPDAKPNERTARLLVRRSDVHDVDES